jgi:uncharacterized membrane protein
MRRPYYLLGGLMALSAIPILVALVRLVQIPLAMLPPEAMRFSAVPAAHFAHALGGVVFGLIGPVQFSNALRRRFGQTHRVLGRVFVVAGLGIALFALRLVWQFPDVVSWPLTLTRLLVALGLGFALIWAVRAARRGARAQHRAWIIRAYALGMGAATQALVMLPIAAVTGAALNGALADNIFIAAWVFNLCLGESVIRRSTAA